MATPTPHNKNKNLAKLKATILGYCGAFTPPTVYMAANTGDRFPDATTVHERSHALLISSTTYGMAEQILCYLLQSNCHHLPRLHLERALDACIENSFHVHEGCATLSEIAHVRDYHADQLTDFMSTLDGDYKHAESLLSSAVSPFHYDGYLRRWIALQVAAICLSPPLFGPLRLFRTYETEAILGVFSTDLYSPDLRLERLIHDFSSGQLECLVAEVQQVVHDTVRAVFGSTTDPPWNIAELRQTFVRECEPLVERCFAKALPGYYAEYRPFVAAWRHTWSEMLSDFGNHSCECLHSLPWDSPSLSIDTQNTRPVAALVSEGHEGARELVDLNPLASDSGTSYYVMLGFCERSDPFVISEDPKRVLARGDIYVRIRPYTLERSRCQFTSDYAFTFLKPDQIRSGLTTIAALPGVRVFTFVGEGHEGVRKIREQFLPLLPGACFQASGMSAEGFVKFLSICSDRNYRVFLLRDEAEHNSVLFLKDQGNGPHLAMPITPETEMEIRYRLHELDQIDPSPGAPDVEDHLVFRHMARFGW
jgi:hypothetical protein